MFSISIETGKCIYTLSAFFSIPLNNPISLYSMMIARKIYTGIKIPDIMTSSSSISFRFSSVYWRNSLSIMNEYSISSSTHENDSFMLLDSTHSLIALSFTDNIFCFFGTHTPNSFLNSKITSLNVDEESLHFTF